MSQIWKWFCAYYRLNQNAVCELSVGKGPYDDYHDYQDDVHGEPWHMTLLKCKHCGKGFYI